jgi:hypothetical protein
MIAANFRKYPEAMALQLVLPFRALVWALPRPTTRLGRAIRAARAAAFKAAGMVRYPEPAARPAWAIATGRMVRQLGKMVRKAQISLDFAEPRKLNAFAQRIVDMREQFDRCPIIITDGAA